MKTDELSNPRPTQGQPNPRKNTLKVHFFPTANSVSLVGTDFVIRRAKPFFLDFPRKKKHLHNGSYEACRVSVFTFSVSCVTQHRNRTLWSTALNAHGTMPVLTGSVHAHTLTKPSRAGFAASRS